MSLKIRTRDNSNNFWVDGTIRVGGKSHRVRESTRTSDPDAAKLFALSLEADILLGKVSLKDKRSPTNLNFDELINQFLRDESTGSSKTTKQALQKFAQSFGDVMVSEFTKADASKYVYEQHTAKGHATNTTRRTIIQIQSILNYAAEMGFRDNTITLRKPAETEKDIVVYTPDQIVDLFAQLKPPNRRFASFILNTGARPIEAANLSKRKVDFKKKTCILTSIKGRDRVARTRTVPLNSKAYAAAHGNMSAPLDQVGELIFTYVFEGEHRVYNTRGGYNYFLRDWSNAATKVGIQTDRRAYNLRHTFGTRLGANNTPFAVISKLMGHTNPQTTMRYLHPTFEDDINAVTSIM